METPGNIRTFNFRENGWGEEMRVAEATELNIANATIQIPSGTKLRYTGYNRENQTVRLEEVGSGLEMTIPVSIAHTIQIEG